MTLLVKLFLKVYFYELTYFIFKDEFLALSKEMSQFYENRAFPVIDVFECQLYAACLDDNPNIWHRIIVEEVKDDGQVCSICLWKSLLSRIFFSFLNIASKF